MFKVLPKIKVTAIKIDTSFAYIQFKSESFVNTQLYDAVLNWYSNTAGVVMVSDDEGYATAIVPSTAVESEIVLEVVIDGTFVGSTNAVIVFDGTDLIVYNDDLELNLVNTDGPSSNVYFRSNAFKEYDTTVSVDPVILNLYFYDQTNSLIDTQSDVSFVFSNRFTKRHHYYYNSKIEVEVDGLNTLLYTKPLFILPIEEDESVHVYAVEEEDPCNNLHAHSFGIDYINKLVAAPGTDNSLMSALNVRISENCCVVDTLMLPPTYLLTLENDTCTATGNIVNIGGDDFVEYETTVKMYGIDTSIIDTITYVYDPVNQFTRTLTGTDVTRFFYDLLIYVPAGTGPGYRGNFYIEFTNAAGFNYRIDFTLKGGVTCIENDLDDRVITYPSYPDYITIKDIFTGYNEENGPYSGNNIKLVPEAFGYKENIDNHTLVPAYFPFGVYSVEIQDTSVCEDFFGSCYVHMCGLECLVYEAISEECDFEILWLYEALKNSRICPNVVSCSGLCNIYKKLIALLEECSCNYKNLTISQPYKNRDCGCS